MRWRVSRTRRSASTSAAVVGIRPRSRSERRDEPVIPVQQAGLLEVASHLVPVRAGKAEKVLHVGQVRQEPRGVVAHRLHLHRREMLGPGHGGFAVAELQAPRAGGKRSPAVSLVDVDDVDTSPVGIGVLVAGVARRDVQRLVAERLAAGPWLSACAAEVVTRSRSKVARLWP